MFNSVSSRILLFVLVHMMIIAFNWNYLASIYQVAKHSKTTLSNFLVLQNHADDLLKQSELTKALQNQEKIATALTNLDKSLPVLESLFVEEPQYLQKVRSIIYDMNQAKSECRPLCPPLIAQQLETMDQRIQKALPTLIEKMSSNEDRVYLVWVMFFLELLMLTVLMFVIFKLVSQKLEKERRNKQRYIDLIDKHIITSSTDLFGTITYVSDAFCRISGYTKKELIGKNHNIVRHPDMPKTLYETMWERLKSGKSWQGEVKNKAKDGSFYWVRATISPKLEDGKVIGYTAIRYDITDKKKMEAISFSDPLTGLFNRRRFIQECEKMLAEVRQNNENVLEPQQVYLIIIDVDHFNHFHQQQAEDIGDKALIRIATAIQSSLNRQTDFAFRLGAEEFAILMVDYDLTRVREFADTIRARIESLDIHVNQNSIDGRQKLTASMGIGFADDKFGYDFDQLFNRADKAMQAAKHKGGNWVEIYKGSPMPAQEEGSLDRINKDDYLF